MTKIRSVRAPCPMPRNQSGAVLYVALIMLILLALIGVVGMQIATLQERMSANYMATNVAFQNTESQVRTREIAITANAAFPSENCAVPFDPKAWANDMAASTTVVDALRTVNIGVCTGECSAASGSDTSESLCNLYRTTGFSRDQSSVAASSSLAAIDTIFIKP